MMQIQIPWQCREILERFSQHHLQAYLVGGCVRDSLLGKQPKDLGYLYRSFAGAGGGIF